MTKVNKIKNIFELPKGKPEFEFIVKRDGKIVYQNKAHAGVLNCVEHVTGIEPENYTIDGITQSFTFGPHLLQIYSFDQLRQKMDDLFRKQLPDILKAINYKP